MPKILIVEDEISLRDVYAARLEADGYQIVVAGNGEEALATAVKERPDLILLDIMMPKISGFDVLDIIRTTPEIADTKVIMMTALSSPEDRARGEKLGVNRYLVKSQVVLEEMVKTISDVLQEPSKGGSTHDDLVGASGNQRAAVSAEDLAKVEAGTPPEASSNAPSESTLADKTASPRSEE